jgi:hypothetical protein
MRLPRQRSQRIYHFFPTASPPDTSLHYNILVVSVFDCATRDHGVFEKLQQRKGELQLDLFEPRDWQYEFKVIITNKTVRARAVTRYHEGRGSQEGIFAEAKTDVAMGHIPVRTRNGNQAYLLAGLMAHNLTRELQMCECPPQRGTNMARAARWIFDKVGTLRRHVFHRAGRLTRPGGRLTLTINASDTDRQRILSLRDAASKPANAAA